MYFCFSAVDGVWRQLTPTSTRSTTSSWIYKSRLPGGNAFQHCLWPSPTRSKSSSKLLPNGVISSFPSSFRGGKGVSGGSKAVGEVMGHQGQHHHGHEKTASLTRVSQASSVARLSRPRTAPIPKARSESAHPEAKAVLARIDRVDTGRKIQRGEQPSLLQRSIKSVLKRASGRGLFLQTLELIKGIILQFAFANLEEELPKGNTLFSFTPKVL